MMIRLTVAFIILLLQTNLLFAQIKSVGTSPITNYPKSQYKAGTQNWDVAQDTSGFLYFANNEGVLQFNGISWSLIDLINPSPVRSVFVDEDNAIFIGQSNDFGFLKAGVKGKFVFQSLKEQYLNSGQDFDEIWKIHKTQQGIIFQSFSHLFLFKEDKIDVFTPQNQFHFSFCVNNSIYIQEQGIGLFDFVNQKFIKLDWADKIKDYEIIEILSVKGDKLLIFTARNGVFEFANNKLTSWNNPVNEQIKLQKLFSAALLRENYLALGTIRDGVIITNLEGQIIQQVNRDNGLQNNTVLTLFNDRDNNLWLGLDNGIDYMEVNTPITYLGKNQMIGAVYCAIVFNDNLYVGTNQGLFVKQYKDIANQKIKFRLVAGTEGQVWSIQTFDNQLICGHNLGVFRVNGSQAKRINDIEGVWNFQQLKQNPEYLLCGHYNGLMLFEKDKNGLWAFYREIKGFKQSSRYIFQAKDNTIWIGHGFKGLFKIKLNPQLDSVVMVNKYGKASGLPSDKNNIILNFDGQFIVSTINHLYRYNNKADRFEPADQYNSKLNFDSQLLYSQKDNAGNIWFITESESGYLIRNEDGAYDKVALPFNRLNGKHITSFEFLHFLNNQEVLFGLDDGFAHYATVENFDCQKSFASFITHVEIPNADSVIYFNFSNSRSVDLSLPYKNNSLKFYFSAPFYQDQPALRFSYFIENYSKRWSDWSSNGYTDFSNFREGSYTFKVKAKNTFDKESDVATLKFSIFPPWYRSNVAYFIYLLLFLLIMYFILRWTKYQNQKKLQREQYQHKKELEAKEQLMKNQSLAAEKEIIRLRNEKLRAEMIHRDKELANQTMGLVQKNRFLITLKDEIKLLNRKNIDFNLRKGLTSILRQINVEIGAKDQNKIFKTYFDEAHEQFFEKLKEEYPNLTPKDLRLCAYIKMNMSTKEIAAIQNISTRGVEISRYRLRKKLNLTRSTNLSLFLSNV